MAQACAAWSRLFAPLDCYDTFLEATASAGGSAVAGVGGSGGGGGDEGASRLAQVLGLGPSAAAAAPDLSWVRGWPIKPLALLLTRHDRVIMLDADRCGATVVCCV